MGFGIIKKDLQLINLSKEDFIIKETLLERRTTIMNLVTLKIRYGIVDDAPDLSEYDYVFAASKETANLSDINFINMLKERSDSWLVTMLEDVLTYYLNNMLKYVAGLNMSVDSVFEDYEDLVQYSKDQDAKGDKRISKMLYIYSNLMFSLFFLNLKYRDGLKEQTKENIIPETYVDEETGAEFKKYLVPYCLALRSTVCGITGEFKIKGMLNKIRMESGFHPYNVPSDSPLFEYFENLYESSADFQDLKILELAYMDSNEEFGIRKFTLYRTLEKGYVIVFG